MFVSVSFHSSFSVNTGQKAEFPNGTDCVPRYIRVLGIRREKKKNQNQNSPVLRITTYLVLYTTPPNIVTEMLYQAFTQSKFGSSVQGV